MMTMAGCATEPAPGGEQTDRFELEPGLFVSLAPLDFKGDLPNGALAPRPLDTSGYRAIAKKFVDAGLDVTLTGAAAAYDWPLSDSRAVLSRQGTPIRLSYHVYEHTGLDVIRNSETESPVVHAPTTGTAMITDWSGDSRFPYGDYSTVISIWDPTTHHVLQLMHVKPDPGLPRTGVFEVVRGQAIGELADIHIVGGKHMHVNVIDAENFELIDPVTVMPEYPDTTKPTIGEVYLLDAAATRLDTLATGPLDLVVSAHDRDDSSLRNLEIASVAFSAKDQDGRELLRLPRCRLSDAFKALAQDSSMETSTIRLIDFGNAMGQFSGFWPSSDLGNPDRLFRYAVTNLRIDQGQCTVVASDRDGQLEIGPEVTALTVFIQLWDSRGNRTTKLMTFKRDLPAQP